MLLPLLLACSGGPEPEPTPQVDVTSSVPDDVANLAWPVLAADPAARAELDASGAWMHRFQGDLGAAISASEGVTAGRMHADAAALYRQAALLQANAIVETYSEAQRREGDPAEVRYLLGVAYVIQGDLEAGQAELGLSGDSPVTELAAADTAWAAAASAEGFSLDQAPQLAGLPEVQVGAVPDLPATATYKVRETVGSMHVGLSDPTLTLNAALWHEAAADLAFGAPGVTDALLSPWRLSLESAGEPTWELPLAALYLGPWMSTDDLRLAGDPESYADNRGVYGSVLTACEMGGDTSVECLLDQLGPLESQLVSLQATAAGMEAADHRVFAAPSEAGVLRVAARIARSQDDERTAALLRLNALDRGGEMVDPVFIIHQAAWDTGQRNVLRSQELLFGQLESLPGLLAVRLSLDALNLRVSRDGTTELPKH
jgi:hypothetical protein